MVEPSDELHAVFDKAVADAKKLKHEYITVEHFAFAMLCSDSLPEFLKSIEIDSGPIKSFLYDYLISSCDNITLIEKNVNPKKTKTVERVLNRAFTQVLFLGKQYIDLTDILLSVLSENQTYACYMFNKAGLNKEKFTELLHDEFMPDDMDDDDEYPNFKDSEKVLDHFTQNLNKAVIENKIDPVIGRVDELEQIMLAMGRRNKNNALLVGFEGTGKTSIVEGLAWNIVNDDVPEFLKNSTVYSLDIGAMLAGARYRGDFEERFKMLMNALMQQEDAILFIDEAHMVNGAGSGGKDTSNDLANLLKPALAKGDIRIVASTTWDEYRKYFEKDRALMRRFQRITVDEPDRNTAVEILKGSSKYYENFHKAKINDRALESAVDLSIRYIHDRKLPDKAFDLVDQACARFKLTNQKTRNVTISRIQYEVSKVSGLPLSKITEKESSNLKNLEKNLKSCVFGQNVAIETIVNKIMVSQAGLKQTNKPVGSFVFRGSTGTGKSYTATQLASLLGVNLVRFDMSEYQERHSVSKLIGSPPGYVGYEENAGLLITQLQENPGCVLLLDEIEKAHPDVSQILLQMMDNGKVTGSNGKSAKVTESIIILTTNLDARESDKNSIGFGSLERDYGDDNFKQFFAPEFRNRLDAVITFNRLNKETMKLIINKYVNELQSMVENKKIKLKFTEDSIDFLVRNGFDPRMGARPLERVLDKYVKQPLSRKMLIGDLKNGGNVLIDVRDDVLELINSENNHILQG